MKTKYTVRGPTNIKSKISQRPLIGPYSTFELKPRGPERGKIAVNKDDLPQMENNLKILKSNISATTGQMFRKFETEA